MRNVKNDVTRGLVITAGKALLLNLFSNNSNLAEMRGAVGLCSAVILAFNMPKIFSETIPFKTVEKRPNGSPIIIGSGTSDNYRMLCLLKSASVFFNALVYSTFMLSDFGVKLGVNRYQAVGICVAAKYCADLVNPENTKLDRYKYNIQHLVPQPGERALENRYIPLKSYIVDALSLLGTVAMANVLEAKAGVKMNVMSKVLTSFCISVGASKAVDMAIA